MVRIDGGAETTECMLGHCKEHMTNSYRINELEKAKEELCKAKKNLHDKMSKITVIVKLCGAVISISFITMVSMSYSGWNKLADFTDKMYQLREADHESLEKYKLDSHTIHMRNASTIINHNNVLLEHSEEIEKLQGDK